MMQIGFNLMGLTAPHRTAPHSTAQHRTAPHRPIIQKRERRQSTRTADCRCCTNSWAQSEWPLCTSLWLLSPRLASPRPRRSPHRAPPTPLSAWLLLWRLPLLPWLPACLLLRSSSRHIHSASAFSVSAAAAAACCCCCCCCCSSLLSIKARARHRPTQPTRFSAWALTSSSFLPHHRPRPQASFSPHHPFHTSLSTVPPCSLPPFGAHIHACHPWLRTATHFSGAKSSRPARSRLSSRRSYRSSLVPSHRLCSPTLHRASRWPAHPRLAQPTERARLRRSRRAPTRTPQTRSDPPLPT